MSLNSTFLGYLLEKTSMIEWEKTPVLSQCGETDTIGLHRNGFSQRGSYPLAQGWLNVNNSHTAALDSLILLDTLKLELRSMKGSNPLKANLDFREMIHVILEYQSILLRLEFKYSLSI